MSCQSKSWKLVDSDGGVSRLGWHSSFSKAGIPAVPPQNWNASASRRCASVHEDVALLPIPEWVPCSLHWPWGQLWLRNRAGFSWAAEEPLRSVEPVGSLLGHGLCWACPSAPLQKFSLHLANSSLPICPSLPLCTYVSFSPFLPWHRQMGMMETYMDHSPWVEDLAGFV